MRWISYALIAGGFAAISAGLYSEHVSGSRADMALAPIPEATAVIRNAATVTATMPSITPSSVAPPASSLDPVPTLTPAPETTVEAAAPAPAEQPLSPVGQSETLQAAAPAATVLPSATATPATAAVAPTQPPAPTATPRPPEPPAAPVSLGGLEQQMFAAHNAERANAGVGALQLDGTLTQLARQRAQDMASKNYFSHTSPTGQTAFTLLSASGYVYTLAGENLARNNYPDSQSVSTAMSGFMASPTHRINVLEPKFSRVGIGMAVGADGMKYFAVIFAAK